MPNAHCILHLFAACHNLTKQVMLFKANPVKVKSLTIGKGGFAVIRIATVGTNILVCVHCLHLHFSLDGAVPYVDPCVQKHNFLG